MALSDFQPDRETVTVKRRGKDPFVLSLRGLNVMDLTTIIKTHFPDLEQVGAMFDRAGGGEMTQQSMVALCQSLVGHAPGLVAHIICRAADDPDGLEGAARLPFMTQVEALQVVGRLTFEEAGSVKKMIADLQGVLSLTGSSDQSAS